MLSEGGGGVKWRGKTGEQGFDMETEGLNHEAKKGTKKRIHHTEQAEDTEGKAERVLWPWGLFRPSRCFCSDGSRGPPVDFRPIGPHLIR